MAKSKRPITFISVFVPTERNAHQTAELAAAFIKLQEALTTGKRRVIQETTTTTDGQLICLVVQ